MGVNLDKPLHWKEDIARSVDLYNTWFVRFAPEAFRKERGRAISRVQEAFALTNFLSNIKPEVLRQKPDILAVLRMSTCPPIARDRLIGLAQISPSIVDRMEKAGKLPERLESVRLDAELAKIGDLIEKLAVID